MQTYLDFFQLSIHFFFLKAAWLLVVVSDLLFCIIETTQLIVPIKQERKPITCKYFTTVLSIVRAVARVPKMLITSTIRLSKNAKSIWRKLEPSNNTDINSRSQDIRILCSPSDGSLPIGTRILSYSSSELKYHSLCLEFMISINLSCNFYQPFSNQVLPSHLNFKKSSIGFANL